MIETTRICDRCKRRVTGNAGHEEIGTYHLVTGKSGGVSLDLCGKCLEAVTDAIKAAMMPPVILSSQR